MKGLATILMSVLTLSVLAADPPRVTARLEPDSIAIGDHFRLRIQVEKDLMQVVGFPERDPMRGDMLTDRIEILEELPVDTIVRDGRRLTLLKELVLTTFEAGVHHIGGIPVLYLDKNITDTLFATPDTLRLEVGTFEIDTLTQTIHDITPPLDAPLRFGEVSGWLFGSLGLAVIVAAALWLWRRWRKAHPKRGSEALLPPHVAAIQALEALHHRKLWQAGKHKLYHSLLTDIVRTYIEARYAIAAMEMTTPELLEAMGDVPLGAKTRSRLEAMLRRADLAKFAKFVPSNAENEASYDDAFYFVEQTKPSEVEPITRPEL